MRYAILVALLLNAGLLGAHLWFSVPRTAAADPTEFILDNGKPGTSSTGTWKSSGAPNPYGGSSLYGNAGPTYTFTLSALPAGSYEVYAWWTAISSRGTEIPYEITHSNGVNTVKVNQKVNGGKWNLLGTFSFSSAAKVRISAVSPSSVSTCADAVRLVRNASQPDLLARVKSLEDEVAESRELLSHFKLDLKPSGSWCFDDEYPENDRPPTEFAKTIVITGVNVQIVNGAGATSTTNGLGNMIIGYQEPRGRNCEELQCWDEHEDARRGSHNLIVGARNNYNSYGSAVIGLGNTVWEPLACAVGGSGNKAWMASSFVAGGQNNFVGFPNCGIVGGYDNYVGVFQDPVPPPIVLVGGRGQQAGETIDCGTE